MQAECGVESKMYISKFSGAALAQKPWEPVPKDEEWWMERHYEIVNNTAAHGKDIKVVFVGSSSVEYWNTTAKDLWDSKYAPLGAVNYGIRGDRTEHVLWRIANGEFDGLNPKLVVIYIGSNNVPVNTEAEVVRGVDAIIDSLHAKLPKTNLLFNAFFPRGDKTPVKDTLTKIRNITDTLKPMIDGDTKRNAHFLDFFWSLAPESLDRIHEQYYRDDKLHMNRDGYTIWDDKMNSTFYSLIQ